MHTEGRGLVFFSSHIVWRDTWRVRIARHMWGWNGLTGENVIVGLADDGVWYSGPTMTPTGPRPFSIPQAELEAAIAALVPE